MRSWIRSLAIAVIAVAGIAHADAQTTEKRIALVIGNSAYQDSALASPANDAGLVAQTLQAAGFDVIGARDLDMATMRSSFREFVDKASAAGPDAVALVYFAGHGLQFEGENYLVPVDAHIVRDSDVPLNAVRITDLVKPLAELQLKARIIVLDAARAASFPTSGLPLAGGLALMQPDPGTLIAFNAAPGTIGPETADTYGAYATALSEMIKEGGLPLNELFERVRLRVNELTKGGEVAWHATRVEAPFLFFERTAAAPPMEANRFADLEAKPIRDFDAHDAYLAALARDTMHGYEDFLAVYPRDPLARRVRAIIAARREAMVWRESALADTPDSYWSYLQRYPHGPHADDAHRRLAHYAAAFEPPPSFAPLVYDVPPPPPDEIIYVDHPVLYFADPVYDLPPPPPVPVFFLPPRPAYFVDLPPPPPPFDEFVLPTPVYYPVPDWVERPTYVAPPPVNVVNVNIHNTVVIDQRTQSVVVTNPAGQQIQPIPANVAQPQQPAMSPQPAVNGQQNFIQAHPAASAAIGAAAVALPAAAALRARQQTRPANTQNHQVAPGVSAPGQAAPGSAPAANAQQPQHLGVNPQAQHPGSPAVTPVHGAQPLPVPNASPAAGRALLRQGPGVAQTPAIAPGTQTAPNGQAQPQPNPSTAHPAGQLGHPAMPATATHPPAVPASQGTPAAANVKQLQQQQTEQAVQQRAQQAADRKAQQEQAVQQRAAQQQAAQQRAQQAAQQRAQQQAAQQQAVRQQQAQQAAQQRAQQAAQQRAAQQQQQAAAQRAAQQAAQQQAARQQQALQAAQQAAAQRAQQQAAAQRVQQQKRPSCGHPGELPCH